MGNIETNSPNNNINNLGGNNKSFVFYNPSLLEENNAMYDPSKINTNILDVNFQNKINYSADEYLQGKMFEQNYTISTLQENKDKELEKTSEINIDNNIEKNSEKEKLIDEDNNKNDEGKFEVPKKPEKKRKSRFDN